MKQGKNKRNNTQNLKEYIQQLAQTGIKELTDIVFPPACPVCGGVLGFEKGRRRQICQDCDNRLEYIGEPRCMKCGKPLKKTDTQQFCYDCTVKRHFMNAVWRSLPIRTALNSPFTNSSIMIKENMRHFTAGRRRSSAVHSLKNGILILCFPYRCMQPNKENADIIRQN